MGSTEIRLGSLVLQPGRQVLADGAPVELRRKPLEILTVLAHAEGALVTKDELIEAVWPNRLVEESALQVHIVALRKALGCEADRLKTVYGLGYRLELSDQAALAKAGRPARPSIAVLPLSVVGDAVENALLAEALPHELIAELSRLRWLFVIARASSFQFRDSDPDFAKVRETLGVRYCLSGTLEQDGGRIAVTLDLVDTRSLEVIWGNRFTANADAILELRMRIVAEVAAALDFLIPLHEAQRAASNPSEQLDAWSLYHLALQHVFRSTSVDNAAAQVLFEQAAARDPSFARAKAGLSFTHFQNAFMRYVSDTDCEAMAARRHAEQAISLDPADPFANLVMGRSLWLTGELADSRPWIDRALLLNPNYAQGAYAHSFADAVLCDGAQGQTYADRAMALSPIDPMHYAMMGSRALSHAVRGERDAAADWADRAARAPNSHVFIAMIAVLSNALADRDVTAERWASAVRADSPELGRSGFFHAFPFAKSQIRSEFSAALARFGF